MGRLPFNGTALFEIHLSDVAHCFGQQIPPLILRSQQDEIDKTFAHLRHQFRQVALLMSLDMLLHHLVYLAVQALGFALCHALSPFEFRDCTLLASGSGIYPRDGCRCRPALFMVDAPPRRGVKIRVASLAFASRATGLSILTPRLAAGRWNI